MGKNKRRRQARDFHGLIVVPSNENALVKFLDLRPLTPSEKTWLTSRISQAVAEKRSISLHLFSNGIVCGMGGCVENPNLYCFDRRKKLLDFNHWFSEESARKWGDVSISTQEDMKTLRERYYAQRDTMPVFGGDGENMMEFEEGAISLSIG